MIESWVKVEALLDSLERNSMAHTICVWALPRLEELLLQLEDMIEKQDLSEVKEEKTPDQVLDEHPQQSLNMTLNRQAIGQVRKLIQRLVIMVDATEKTVIRSLQGQLHEDTRQLRKWIEQHCTYTIDQLQPWLIQEQIEDFYVLRQTEWGRLVIAGSRDYSYYHNVELIFHEVQFLMLPTQVFTVERIRLATAEERADLNRSMHGHEQMGRVFCLESSFEGTRYYVVARQLEYNTDTVYYYNRPELGQGERIAEYLLDPNKPDM